MKALDKLAGAILGNRRLPKPAPPRQRLKPAEARARLKQFVTTLRSMDSERSDCEAANAALEAAQKLDLSELWQAGEDLPDLAGMKARFENSRLRAKAAAAAGNATAEAACNALTDLQAATRETLESARAALEKSVAEKLGVSKFDAHPSSVRDILLRTSDGEKLATLEAIHAPSIPLQLIEPAGAERSRDGKKVAVELRPALLPWRTEPIAKEHRDKHGNFDQWKPLHVARDLENFLAHSEAVEKFVGGLTPASK